MLTWKYCNNNDEVVFYVTLIGKSKASVPFVHPQTRHSDLCGQSSLTYCAVVRDYWH